MASVKLLPEFQIECGFKYNQIQIIDFTDVNINLGFNDVNKTVQSRY